MQGGREEEGDEEGEEEQEEGGREGVGMRLKGKSTTNESAHTSLQVGESTQDHVYKDLYR